MTEEVSIECYKYQFKELLPNPGYQPIKRSRSEVATGLDNFLKELYPFKQPLKEGKSIKQRKPAIDTIFSRLHSFLKVHFTEPVFEKYFVGSNTLSAFNGNQSLTNAEIGKTAILATFQLLTYGYTEPNRQDYIFKYQKLHEFIQCLKDFGLHPQIDKRESVRYNVIIAYKNDKKQLVEEVLTTISLRQLITDFIIPYYTDKPMPINGRKIYKAKREKLSISTTKLKDDEIILYMARGRFRSVNDFVKACKDETNSLLDTYRPDKSEESNLKVLLSMISIKRTCTQAGLCWMPIIHWFHSQKIKRLFRQIMSAR